jgi:hypothetical protein
MWVVKYSVFYAGIGLGWFPWTPHQKQARRFNSKEAASQAASRHRGARVVRLRRKDSAA